MLEPFSLELAKLATLLFISTLSKEYWIDVAWCCFDTSNCPCKRYKVDLVAISQQSRIMLH
jgi:hypothetical protein